MKRASAYFILFGKIYAVILWMELVLRGYTIGFSGEGNEYIVINILTILCFSLISSSVLCLISLTIGGKPAKLFLSAVFAILSVIYCSQIVYYDIFDTFYTTYSMINGAQVVEFQSIIWSSIGNRLLPMALTFAAAGAGIYLLWRKEKPIQPQEKLQGISVILITCLLFAAGLGIGIFTVNQSDEESETDLDAPYQYLYTFNEIKGSIRSFGLLPGSFLDMYRLITGFEPNLEAEEALPVFNHYPAAEYNVIPSLDFDKLAQQEKDPVLRQMDLYFGGRTPSAKNQKTGLFQGKNLIYITAESFTDFAISEKYTPTLYKLQKEGFTFDHFYNPIWGVSTLDGEYVNCLGMIPEAGVWSLKEAADNSLPFALGNQFQKLGYVTKAYHNHSIYYYDRNLSHPNLGYDFKGQDGGFSFQKTWPESDLEMMEKTVPDFLEDAKKEGKTAPFHIYYLTVSGHLEYDFQDQEMAKKNKDAVKDLTLSDPCKAYMAANIELDRAMESLLGQLEDAGQLKDTVIILAGDHYPYGLTPEEISELKGHTVDEMYEMYESALILWTPGMKPERVEKVCSNLDILPTISNLFGLEYDSRLLMGTDIFSDTEGFMLFEDKNWISDRGTRRDLTAAAKENEEIAEYVEKTDRKAALMFAYSALVLDKDYYGRILPPVSSETQDKT